MNLNDLEAFYKVCENCSFTKAAQELNYVQSNVTAKIQRLESYYQVKLLYRDKKGIKPTPEGIELLNYIKRIFTILHEAEHNVSNNKKLNINIGTIETIAAVHLPKLLNEYKKKNPKIQINLKTDNSIKLIEHVKNREMDCAFISGNINDKDLICTNIFNEKLVILSQKGNFKQNINENKSIIM
ncbi:LysR family transcriptional regulator, partial [Staphylococcus epidermidis]|nr:LysR family transcriptional regulator [Staphylococcus epidermidis]